MVWVSEVGARLHSARNVFLSACREKLGKQYLKSYLWETEKKSSNDLPWEMPVVLQLIHLMFVKAKLEIVSVTVDWTDLNADLGKKCKRFIYKTSREYTQNVREGQGFQGSTGSGEGNSMHAPTLLSATPHTICSCHTTRSSSHHPTFEIHIHVPEVQGQESRTGPGNLYTKRDERSGPGISQGKHERRF